MTDSAAGLNGMGIAQSAKAIRNGQVSAVELAKDCLDRIDEFEETIGAWACLKPEGILKSAEALDFHRQQGHALGPLHGVPIGIKDIIDTAHVPTEYGSPLYAGRVPHEDATVVARLRQAGALIMGKTVTAELANCGPGKTCNPHDPERTPGGSSSGSAAAVAAYMVPGALGTQTVGSIIRPASFCGIYGFKPTYGLIPRTGVLMQSFSHDQLGTFARSVEDIAILTELLIGHDPGDQAVSPLCGPGTLSGIAMSEPPLGAKLAFVKTPMWDEAKSVTKDAFRELCDVLGDDVQEVPLPDSFENLMTWHRTVVEAECAEAYAREYEAGAGKIHPDLRAQIERGQKIAAKDFLIASRQRKYLNALLDNIFDEFDALLTPGATGEAPEGLSSTGDPVFCAPWSFCGTPAISLPLMQGENGLPLGVQLVGRWGDDARLLRTARWLENRLQDS